MRDIFTKLKTSATLWSVIGGFVLGLVNIIWGADTTASSVSSAVMFAAPAVAYIVSKFYLRIKMADVNNDGKISLNEFLAALSIATKETGDEAQEVIDIIGGIIKDLENKANEDSSINNDEAVQ